MVEEVVQVWLCSLPKRYSETVLENLRHFGTHLLWYPLGASKRCARCPCDQTLLRNARLFVILVVCNF